MPDFKTYRLATPEDWDTVPREDLADALIDYESWKRLMKVAEMVEVLSFGTVKLLSEKVFTWVNDGAHHRHVRLMKEDTDEVIADLKWEGGKDV